MPAMAKRAQRKTTPARARDGASTGPTRFEVSAGGVIYRHTTTGIAVCLISTKGGARWQLPKGKREPGESLEQTAAREVAEETGLVGEVGPRLDRIDLWFTWNEDGTPIRHHKLVYFYLLRYRHGSTADHDHEVDDARWFPAEEAIARLTFPNERRVVVHALELVAAEPEPASDPARAP
jgi:8-oxo-dGTP pyrophosphatase MutT (NUDIX family)